MYDGADRPTTVYTTDGGYDTAPGQSGTWMDAGNTLGDNVLTQVETNYDSDSNAILVTTRQRFHDNPLTAQGVGGDLKDPNTLPKARVSYMAGYFDAADRLTDQVDFGTYGAAAFTRPTTPPVRSGTVLVTSFGYLADTVQKVALGGNPSGNFTLTVTVQQTPYTTGNIPVNATAAAVQSALNTALAPVTNARVQVSGLAGGPWDVRFVGSLAGMPVATMTGTATGFSVAVGTTSEGGDTGRRQQMTDPLALVQKIDYDLLGRTVRTIDTYVNFAPSAASDRPTEYTYDGDNHILTLTAWSISQPGAVLVPETTQYVYGVTSSVINSNDLLAQTVYPANGQPNTESYGYDALGEMTTKKDRNFNAPLNLPQTHMYTYDVLGRQTSDMVTVLGTGVDNAVLRLDTAYDTGDRPYLYTSYADTMGNTVVNQVKQVYNGLGQLITEYQSHSGAVTDGTPSVQYAYTEMSNGTNNSRLTTMTYPNGRVIIDNYSAGLDDAISRLTSLQSSGDAQPLEVESYLGLGTVVQRAHPLDNVNLTYIQQPGDTHANHDAGDQYTGLDRFGRVIDQFWLAAASGTATDRFQYSYDTDSNVQARNNLVNGGYNESYTYDQFNQLATFQRGSHTQRWTLDPLGNWDQFTNDSQIQARSNNSQNQITSITGPNTPTYDNNGNTSFDERGNTYTYDAWNRLVRGVSGMFTVTYGYDALGRRITTPMGIAQVATDLYYSAAWQVLEEDQGGAMTAQYVWSPVYIDALVERDSGGQRLYVQQDGNWNVTGVVGLSGPNWVVAERYWYDPYGTAAALDPNTWSPRASQYSWIYLHQGGRYDSILGLYIFRYRDYSPTLGQWMQQDPSGYASGSTNLYGYLDDAPPVQIDPEGLAPRKTYYIQGKSAYEKRLDNDPLDIHGTVRVWQEAESWSGPTDKQSHGIYISFTGKGAYKISFVQFFSAVLEVFRGKVRSTETAVMAGDEGHFESAESRTDYAHEYRDNHYRRDTVDTIDAGGIGGRSADVVWMVDHPGTHERLRQAWHGGKDRFSTPYHEQKDVTSIRLTEYFTTYLVACGKALLQINWESYASWARDQGEFIKGEDEPLIRNTFVSAKLPDEFKDSGLFGRHQELAKELNQELNP